jgi:purine-cytosine permease-like protein
MTSTDDTRSSDARGEHDTGESSADVFVEPIRRRSTYTPPPQYAKPPVEPDPAVSAPEPEPENAAVAPVEHTTDLPFSGVAPHVFEAQAAPAAPAVPVLPDLPAQALPPVEPANPETVTVELVFSDDSEQPAEPGESEQPVDPPTPAEAIPLPAAWEFVVVPSAAEPRPEGAAEETGPPRFMTPDEEAATLARHAPPVGQPWIPQRRSLPDDELVEELADVLDSAADNPGVTLSAMDALENEMRLREEEKQEYREWEDSMLAVGTPEALAAVAHVRPNFTGIVVPPELTPTEAIPVQSGGAQTPTADEDAEPTEPAPAAEIPAPEIAPLDTATPQPPAAATTPDAGVTTDTGAIAAALFDTESTGSTITGQNTIVAALITEAATESAAAARQPHADDADPMPDTARAGAPDSASAETPDSTEIAVGVFGATEFTPSTITGQNEIVAALITEAATESAAAVQQPEAHVEPAPVDAPLFPPPVFADRPAFADGSAAASSPEVDFDSLLAGDGAGRDPAAPAGRNREPEADSTVDDINAFFANATGSTPEQPGGAAGIDLFGPTDTPVGGIVATGAAAAATRAPDAGAASAAVPASRVSHVAERVRAPLFSVEQSGAAPTPEEYRIGRASRLFWLWFAANSSVVSIAFGALVFSLGMSLRQSIMAILAGVALSFIPLGLGTLAGKRSGQPAVIVSRASFGVAGNIVPALLAVVSRVFWGGVLLWLFASSIAAVLVSAGADGGLGYDSLVFLWLVVGAILAAGVAFFGYALFSRVQLVISVLSAVLIVGFVALTAHRVDVPAALTVVDGPWTLIITGTVLVFSFVGLVWANSSSDLARYQNPRGLGSTSMLWASFGTALPTFLLIAYGALLAASDPALASGLAARPIDTLASILPSWYPLPLIAATALSLLSGVIVIVYSGGFALQGVGLRLERQWSTVVVAVLLLVLAAVFSLLSVDLTGLFRDLATTLAVPVAAWVGIFAADTMIRSRKYHTRSLLARGGLYPDVNWANLGALIGITLLGYGLTTATVTLLSWQGYLFALGGVPLDGPLAASDLGVLVALLLGILTPIVSGIPAIRRQETAAV